MTTETLEYPAIDAGPGPHGIVAVAAQQAIDFERLDLGTLALAKFGNWREAAADAAKKAGAELDLSTAAKCTEARSLRKRLVLDPAATARKVATGLKRVLNDTKGKVEDTLEAIVQEYDRIDGLLLPRIEAREAEIEAERQERIRAEAARIKALEIKVDALLDGWMDRCNEPGMTAARIELGIPMLQALVCPADLSEVNGYWNGRKKVTLDYMESMRLKLGAAELARQQAELQRQAAEIAAQRAESERLERLAQERREALAKAEQATQHASTRMASAMSAAIQRVGIEAVNAALRVDEGRTEPLTVEEMDGCTLLLDSLQPPKEQTTQPAASMPVSQDGVDENPDQPQPVLSHLSPGDAAVADPVAEGVATPVDATGAVNVTYQTIKIGQINARLGIEMTRSFIEDTLGVKSCGRDKNAYLFPASKFTAICDALVAHIQKVRGAQ